MNRYFLEITPCDSESIQCAEDVCDMIDAIDDALGRKYITLVDYWETTPDAADVIKVYLQEYNQS